MSFRHAAALALVGWYLLMPPVSRSSSGKLASDLSRPLSEWDRIGVFDSEPSCNKEIDRMHQVDVDWARSHHVMMLDLSHPQCVATDDPRLKEK
jgi:hypothetical protein